MSILLNKKGNPWKLLLGVNMRFNKQISFSGVHMQVVEEVRLG